MAEGVRREGIPQAPASGQVPPPGRKRIRVQVDDLPPVTYSNHLIVQQTGAEIMLWAALVEIPLSGHEPAQALGPDEVGARVVARIAMPPEKFLDHLSRVMEWIERTPSLRAMYQMIRDQQPSPNREKA